MRKTCCLAIILFASIFQLFSQLNANLSIEEIVRVLSADSLQGRKPGESGANKAARYIHDQFTRIGLVMNDNEGYQPFQFINDRLVGQNNHLRILNFEAIHGEDFTPALWSASQAVKAPIKFAGYGFNIEQDSIHRNDYEGIDVKGKIVVIQQGIPSNEKNKEILEDFASDRDKAILARDLGAAGVILVSPTSADNQGLPVQQYEPNSSTIDIPVIYVTQAIADSLAKLESYHSNLSYYPFHSSSHQKNDSIFLQTELIEQTSLTYNVLGILMGNNGNLKDEYIILGAHYDHLGMGGQGSGSRMPDTVAIHPGADDNASGVAGLLYTASILAAVKDSLKRSIMFVAFSAEEMGLLGSKYFTEHLPVPQNNIVAMINLDMIGRLDTLNNSIFIGGVGTSVESKALADSLLKSIHLKPIYSQEGFGPSDHSSFYNLRIPVLYIHTGVHTDYHTPFDKADRINYQGIAKISQFISHLVSTLANRSSRLTFQEAGPAQATSYRKGLKVTLGIMPDFADSNIKGVKVANVRDNAPAGRAGMMKNDVIVAIDGKSVRDIYDYMNRLKTLKHGMRVSIDIIRENRPMILIVEL